MTKTLYLLRHAKSSWKDFGLDDFDRPLSKRGREAAKMMGRYLARHGIEPAQILCSPAKRTRETLDRMQKTFGVAIPTRFEKMIYMADAPSLLSRLQQLADIPSVMVIGHNPGLERLALMLAGSGEGTSRSRLAEKFPTAGMAVLEADVAGWNELMPGTAHLKTFVRPRDLVLA